MSNVIEFAQSKAVVRRWQEREYARLMRLYEAFWWRGDAYHAKAHELCDAAGFRFNVHRPPAGAPYAVHQLVAIGDRYCDKARAFYYRAQELERLLYPARYAFQPGASK